MHTVTRKFTFSAAHRLEGHAKCGRLHGHNYVLEIEVDSTKLKQGMVADFAVIDQVVKPLIDELDHRYLSSETNMAASDPYVLAAEQLGLTDHFRCLPIPYTTAEELSSYIFTVLDNALWVLDVRLVEVRLWENEKSMARYRNDR